MIKAKVTRDDGTHFLLIGLSRNNTQLLHEGHPISVDLTEMGIPGELCIMAGETEEAMRAVIAEHIGPNTIVDDHRGGG